jgi:hypothetical protein
MAVTERPFLQVVAAVHRGEPEAVSIADLEAVRARLFNTPGRRKTAFLIA